ncbi:hypothetical protein KBY96_02155 [Cyanobium sp. ATX 6A2]|uniref:hypothetical protein n=1 Tax=Cyanobium sp. ATX 6A2 TaxID=2823700 RepID=UPI0020CCE3FD|nr:hypothetical protein [Cyanobium sp. ATX 6A2]MCP9886741.1 hypothetical protein [Cyanobium sp. ATX 6A2]
MVKKQPYPPVQPRVHRVALHRSGPQQPALLQNLTLIPTTLVYGRPEEEIAAMAGITAWLAANA